MAIRFTCPRGHKMSAPENRAGRIGKCPECKTLFKVPTPSPDYDGEEILEAEEIIEFYCPNDHYLRSPARLQGKRGKCPDCGSTFVVPSINDDDGEPSASDELEEVEEIEEIEEIEEVEPVEEPSEPTGSGAEPMDFSFVDEKAESYPGMQDPYPPDPSPPSVHGHPLAALFERIWEESDQAAVVELELKSGERITPLHYAHDVSRGQFAVFAIQTTDGTHTLTVLAWDDVARIIVRELKDLPPTMFN